MKKLYRSKEDRLVGGLMAGIGEYAEIDPNPVRLIYALLTILTGIFPGLIAYVLGLLIVPVKEGVTHTTATVMEDDSSKV